MMSCSEIGSIYMMKLGIALYSPLLGTVEEVVARSALRDEAIPVTLSLDAWRLLRFARNDARNGLSTIYDVEFASCTNE